jgi:hypothetical protein
MFRRQARRTKDDAASEAVELDERQRRGELVLGRNEH